MPAERDAKGGGFGEAAGLVAFAVTGGYVAHRFWIGLRRGTADVARGIGAWLTLGPRPSQPPEDLTISPLHP